MRTAKYLPYLLVVGIVGLFIIYFIGKYFVNTSWEYEIDQQTLASFSKKIDSVPDLSINFRIIYDSLNNEIQNNNMTKKYNGLFLKHVFEIRPHRFIGQTYFSEKVFDLFPKKTKSWNSILDYRLVFANGIEKFTTPKKCASFYLTIAKFRLNDTLSVHGIDSLSIVLFNTSIQSLNRNEIIRIIAITDLNIYSSKINDDFIRRRSNVLLSYLKRLKKKIE